MFDKHATILQEEMNSALDVNLSSAEEDAATAELLELLALHPSEPMPDAPKVNFTFMLVIWDMDFLCIANTTLLLRVDVQHSLPQSTDQHEVHREAGTNGIGAEAIAA